MSNRAQAIIRDIETDYGVKFDANFWPDALCQDTTCLYPTCACWGLFRKAVEAEAMNIIAVELAAGYDGAECTLSGSCDCACCVSVYSPTT